MSAAMLDLGDECALLPLQLLALDAARLRRLPLSVRMVSLPPETGGGVLVERTDRAWVLLDPGNSAEVNRIWAHELSHFVDHLDGRVGRRNRRTVGRREAFAWGLADLLLAYEPATITEARPLVVAVRARGIS